MAHKNEQSVEKSVQYCTYIYKDPKTGVIIYVGEGKYPRRPFSHLLKSSKHRLAYVLQKRKAEGFNPQPVIIFASSKKDGEEMQDLLIALIGCEFDKTGTLFNLAKESRGVTGLKYTAEQLKNTSERTKKGAKTLGKEGCSQRSKKAMETLGFNGRSKRAKAACENMGPEKLSARAKKGIASQSPAELSARSQKAMQTMGPDGLAKRNCKIGLRKQKPCTVDGITIYPSRKALVAALGRGKLGTGSVNFRYINQ